jgi:hypothetical protein
MHQNDPKFDPSRSALRQKRTFPRSPLLTQAVWKRFSYPHNCKQPGVMDLDAAG